MSLLNMLIEEATLKVLCVFSLPPLYSRFELTIDRLLNAEYRRQSQLCIRGRPDVLTGIFFLIKNKFGLHGVVIVFH